MATPLSSFFKKSRNLDLEDNEDQSTQPVKKNSIPKSNSLAVPSPQTKPLPPTTTKATSVPNSLESISVPVNHIIENQSIHVPSIEIFPTESMVKFNPYIRDLDKQGGVISRDAIANNMSTSGLTKANIQNWKNQHGPAVKASSQTGHEMWSLLRSHFKCVEDPSPDLPTHEWSSDAHKTKFIKLLEPLCVSTIEFLKKDKMLLEIPTPAYILGDLHGSYRDLEFFQKNFWNCGVDFTPSNFVFLGDFVDKGYHPLEVTAHIFALKIMFPNQVFLLRGNHEFESQNGKSDNPMYFKEVCKSMIQDEKEAVRIWRMVNSCFDWLPVAGTIKNKIFVCHGGIPRHINNTENLFEDIMNIKRPLDDYSMYSG
eukprot:TRINITY_DN4026_c0_g1_i1.p1 TRINITY_DN4026_c0_g1~~TRINITY_DN4026_c0_g1_i1.p1  ORF type:complete len:369 (+),score=71.27 TRINITY_DN4026_c0_g1_i1:39-1145(+)